VCCAAFPPPRPSSHPVDVGLRSEAAIVEALLRRGYSVSVPRGSNQRYDLIVDVGRLLRVQCKTGRLRGGAITFSTRSVRSNTRGARWRDYHGEVDYFLVFCPDTDGVYAIPIEEAARGYGCLRVAPPTNNQAKGIRWAREYELPAIDPPRT
jgi:hypothetical protein